MSKGEVVYLQSKHFDEAGRLFSNLHPDLKADNITEKHLLKDGDVLFSAKGSKNIAVVFESHNSPAVASTSFFVLRHIDKKVLPEYLAWFMNSPATQILLKRGAIGTAIPSISKQVLEVLEIPVPDLKIQEAILHITKLYKHEKLLKNLIEGLREKQIQQQIKNVLKKTI